MHRTAPGECCCCTPHFSVIMPAAKWSLPSPSPCPARPSDPSPDPPARAGTTAAKERRRSVARKRSRRVPHCTAGLTARDETLSPSISATSPCVLLLHERRGHSSHIVLFVFSKNMPTFQSSCGVVQRARGREVSPQSLPSTNIFLPSPDCPPLTSSWKGRFYAACIHAAAVALLFMGLNAIA